jgi:cytochrome c
MCRLRLTAGIGALIVMVCSWPAAAQLQTYDVGRAPTAEEGLPTGSGTATLGKPIYVEHCASCHGGEKGEDAKYDRLVGGHGTLATAKPIRTVGSFWPYVTTLWSYIRRGQPFDSPGSLTADQVYAVTAYLLYLNGIIGEHDVLDAKTLPQVKMPNRDGFVSDPRPDLGKISK